MGTEPIDDKKDEEDKIGEYRFKYYKIHYFHSILSIMYAHMKNRSFLHHLTVITALFMDLKTSDVRSGKEISDTFTTIIFFTSPFMSISLFF